MNIKSREMTQIQKILREFLDSKTVRVYVFGSRAGNRARPESDLDILLRGTSEIPYSTLTQLKEAFEESDIPYKIDVLDYFSVSDRFRKKIESQKKILRY